MDSVNSAEFNLENSINLQNNGYGYWYQITACYVDAIFIGRTMFLIFVFKRGIFLRNRILSE